MTLSEFTNWANGQSLPKYNDGQFPGECVSLINQYCYRVLNVPAGAWGNAKDWATNATALKYFTKVSTPQRGDVLVYPATKTNPDGHIEIYLGNNQSLQQNRFLDRKTHISTVWPGYTAVLRPNKKEDNVLTHQQVDHLLKMGLRREPTAEELNNQKYHENAGLLVDTLWNNGGEAFYKSLNTDKTVQVLKPGTYKVQ